MEVKQYPLSKEQWAHNKATWTKYHAEKISGYSWHHLLVALVRNIDPFVAFQPLKNPHKIEKYAACQGRSKYYSLTNAVMILRSILTTQKHAFAKPEQYAKWGTEAGKMKLTNDLYFNMTAEYVDILLEKSEAIYEGIKERSK